MKRRTSIRYEANSIVDVIIRDTNRIVGSLANLSIDGAMFITSEPVKLSTIFRCKVMLQKPILNRDELWFEATCCWCRKNIRKDRWESGYKLEVDGIDKELISYLSLVFVLDGLEYKSGDDVKSVLLENRRKSERYESEFLFPVYEKNSSLQVGRIVDISQTGIMINQDSALKEGAIVEYRAKLPKRIFQRDYLIFKSECRWSKKDDANGKFKIGLQFINLSQKDSVIILYLIIHYLKECSSSHLFTHTH